jgi:hypothetical protein
VFHVAFLKKHQGEPPPEEIVVLPLIVNGRAMPTPENVVRAKPNHTSWDLLVQWIGTSKCCRSCYLVAPGGIQRQIDIQNSSSEGVFLGQEGRSVVDTLFGKWYSRRKKSRSRIMNLVSCLSHQLQIEFRIERVLEIGSV